MKVSDLDFKPHSAGMGGTMASVFFDNGFGASVITGGMFYTSPNHPYELAVLKGVEGDSDLTYDTSITNDVLGHQTEEDVNDVLKRISEL